MMNDEFYDFNRTPQYFGNTFRKLLKFPKRCVLPLTKIGCLFETAYFVSKLYETHHTTGHDSQRTIFSYAQKACGKGFFRREVVVF